MKPHITFSTHSLLIFLYLIGELRLKCAVNYMHLFRILFIHQSVYI